jgi:peptidoglycan/xylan/chitin deacetylase (PgdA/CDA1 family)
MLGSIILWLKWFAFWLADSTAALEFLLHGKKPRPGLTILCYHRIADGLPRNASLDPFNVSPAIFAGQMSALRSLRSVKLVSAKTVAGWMNGRSIPQGSYLMVTFDDGYQNVLSAAEMLHKEKWPGVFFVTTGYIEKPIFDFNPYDRWCRGLSGSDPSWYRPLCFTDCQKLLELGMEIQLHGHLHRPLGILGADELHEEIHNCKTTLEGALGCEAIAIAYPYGNSRANHFNARVESCLQAMSIQFAVSTDAGTNDLADLKNHAYRLRRIPVHEHDRGLLFKAKAAGYCGIMPFAKAVAYRMGIWTRVPP